MHEGYIGAGVGAGAGVAQTFGLRYADDKLATSFTSGKTTTPPLLMKQLKGFGSASALGGIIGAVVAGAVAAYSIKKGHMGTGTEAGLVSYAASAGVGGVASGIMPTAEWAAAVAADPPAPGAARAIAGGARVIRLSPRAAPSAFAATGAATPLSASQVAARSTF